MALRPRVSSITVISRHARRQGWRSFRRGLVGQSRESGSSIGEPSSSVSRMRRGFRRSNRRACWVRQNIGPDPAAGTTVTDGAPGSAFDRTFDDPAVLITYLAHALAQIINVEEAVFEGLAAPHPTQRRAILASLALSISTTTYPFLLAVDDAHLLTNGEGIDIVKTLVDHLQAGSQIALLGAASPDWASAMAGRGQGRRHQSRRSEAGRGGRRRVASSQRGRVVRPRGRPSRRPH